MKKWRISIYACELETEEENNVARIETERDEVNDRLSHRHSGRLPKYSGSTNFIISPSLSTRALFQMSVATDIEPETAGTFYFYAKAWYI